MAPKNLCFAMHGSAPIQISVDLPCGVTNSSHPHVNCCVNGDYCMSNSICRNTKEDGTYGYYNADCTDPTLQDPICGTRCGGRVLADLAYIGETGYWACCWNRDDGKVDCDNPSDEIYPAPAPSDLKIIQYLPKTELGTPTYATAPMTASGTAGSTASSSSSPSSSPSNGISAGTAAGIGVGAAAGIIIIAAVVVFFFRGKTKNIHHKLPYDYPNTGNHTAYPGPPVGPQVDGGSRGELLMSAQVYEMDKNTPTPELDTRRSISRQPPCHSGL